MILITLVKQGFFLLSPRHAIETKQQKAGKRGINCVTATEKTAEER